MYNIDNGIAAALQAARESNILLVNKDKTLPLAPAAKIAYFGRNQKHYIYSGTGSGVTRPPYRRQIPEALETLGACLDKEVEAFYDAFEAEHPYEDHSWAPPTSQLEAVPAEELVAAAAERNGIAIFQLSRISGEGRDIFTGPGEYRLSAEEKKTLKLLRKYFARLVIIANISSAVDFSEILAAKPDALLLAWGAGIEGATAVAETLVGTVNPSGHLPDTIAKHLEDYPVREVLSADNPYTEDIFVGYRYFETIAPKKVLYPFGYGLSYTTFAIEKEAFGRNSLAVRVTNTGDVPGKCVVQCYAEVKPADPDIKVAKRVLVAFGKTGLLVPGQSEKVILIWADREISRFDDAAHARVLDAGRYTFYIGENIRSAKKIGAFTVKTTYATEVAPQEPYTAPAEIPLHGKDGLGYADLKAGRITVDDLVARLSREELEMMFRAEGMDSPKSTPGNAAVFGGVFPGAIALGIPMLTCIDGPTGVRMEGSRPGYEYPATVSYPTAIAMASSWNEELLEAGFAECGREMLDYKIDILLAPGMNIHRYPLCGRNFEYYSEDPLLTGKMAAAVCRGLGSVGASGVIKHFMANNHEFNRQGTGAIISERAMREIYVRGFEIALCESPVRGVMTSYNRVNGHWASCNRRMITGFLREELGFDGIIMTDWWARSDRTDGRTVWQDKLDIGGYRPPVYEEMKAGTFMPPLGFAGDHLNFREILHAGGDLYMVVRDCAEARDNLAEAPLAELQQAARHIIGLCLALEK